MKLTVIATGSTGNCYVLEGRRSALILEAGVPPEKMMAGTTLDMTKVAGVLLTHEHRDHAAFAARYAQLGLPLYCSTGTWACLSLPAGARCELLHNLEWRTDIADFEVLPFRTQHDAAEPFGYVIKHRELGTLVFLTDSRPIPYSFKAMKPDHIMVEANFDDGLLDDNVVAGEIDQAQATRVRSSHLSIREAMELVRANETASLKTVTLIHLSSRNADRPGFQKRMQDAVLFADVKAPRPGDIIYMNGRTEL